MADADLDGLITEIEEGKVSGSQLERLFEAVKHTANRRVHISSLVKLARSQWLHVDKMGAESDGKNVYLRLTLKIVIGQK